MRVVIQRVSEASVRIDAAVHGAINQGLVVLVGVGPEDDATDISWLAEKITNQRIFPDADGKMNLSVVDKQGAILVISQFTLFASTKKGTRPAFTGAAAPQKAQQLYHDFVDKLKTLVSDVQCGVFAADMKVALINDGPVTISIDSRNRE